MAKETLEEAKQNEEESNKKHQYGDISNRGGTAQLFDLNENADFVHGIRNYMKGIIIDPEIIIQRTGRILKLCV
ncbi:3090_t:CDS:2 [Entrophospora sp. SA101]|nr:3090_t:CDS:2 [Entrophospora sp. SA101]